MIVGVIGNGMTATFMVCLLLKNGFKVIQSVNPYEVPHSWASAGIVHPFNFKTASWKKFGYNSFINFLQFLDSWNIKEYFHPVGLKYYSDEHGLWNDWYALSVRFPEFIQIQENYIFFPKSGYLQVKKVWDILNHKFLKFSNYQRTCYSIIPDKQIPIFIHAGGIESLKDNPKLPIYPKEGQIFKISTPKPIVSTIYWKQFFIIPTANPLEYWIGPNHESLDLFHDNFKIDFHILKSLQGVKPYSYTGRAFCLKQNNIIYLNGVGGRGILEGLRIANEALALILK